jgi:MoxR-like ATPase
MAIDFATFRSIAPYVLNVRKPVLIRGRHGIGKSEVVYQIARDLGLPVVERRCSQMTEGDLLGMPSAIGVEIGGKRATTWDAPDWLLTACAMPVVMFLDEVDRGTMEVRQGIFELTDSRKIAGVTLHPDTLIIAAVNGGNHGSQYQVGEMDPAELDRWTAFDLEPTVEDWLTWGKDNVHGLIWDFINQNRKDLEHAGDFEPNKKYPSRRSWKRLNDCLVAAKLTSDAATKAPIIYNLACGFVGFEAAVKLKAHVENYKEQVTVEDILDAGKASKTKDFTVTDHAALVEKIAQSGRLKEALDAKVLKNLGAYWLLIPSEVSMKLYTEVGRQFVKNAVAMHAIEVDGVKLGGHLATMLGAGRNK